MKTTTNYQLKSVSDKATQASDNSFVTGPSDALLAVADLKLLKVTEAGIVYLPRG